MNIVEFKNTLVEILERKLSDKEKLTIKQVFKNNLCLEGITIVPAEANGKALPTLYVEHLYEESKQREDMDAFAEEILGTLRQAAVPGSFSDYELMPEKIFPKLVNTKANEEYLKKIPNREYLDLSVIYYVEVCTTMEGTATVTVTNELAAENGWTEQFLYETALKNQHEQKSCMVSSLFGAICELVGEDDEVYEMLENNKDELNEGMFVITNSSRLFGSPAILEDSILTNIGKVLKEDFYVLPSSVHEVIAIKADKPIDVFSDMVYEINMYQVHPEERLSHSIYRFNVAENRLEIAFQSDENLV